MNSGDGFASVCGVMIAGRCCPATATCFDRYAVNIAESCSVILLSNRGFTSDLYLSPFFPLRFGYLRSFPRPSFHSPTLPVAVVDISVCTPVHRASSNCGYGSYSCARAVCGEAASGTPSPTAVWQFIGHSPVVSEDKSSHIFPRQWTTAVCQQK